MVKKIPLDFDSLGIGSAIKRHRLFVPLNQREYAWEDKQVTELLQDIAGALDNKPAYFLGTIVLTRGADERLEVVDGQQRLATTSILLAAIRDYLCEMKDDLLVRYVEDFLFVIDPDERDTVPRLRLNVDDNEFFHHRVLARPNEKRRTTLKPPKLASHKLIESACRLAKQHVEDIVKPISPNNRIDLLTAWVKYLEESVQTIFVTAADDVNAFVMFETQNDRGLTTSQADLVKNYLFSKAGDRITEAQYKWSMMRGTLEALGDNVLMTYLRHHVISQYGYTIERDVLSKIRDKVNNKPRSHDLLESLSDSANDYVAIQTPEHAKWNHYGGSIREHIRTLDFLGVKPLRPLMLAVAKGFSKAQAAEAFRLFVCWSVRFLITGGHRSGTVEKACAESAREVTAREITQTDGLVAAMGSIIPSDSAFEAAFSVARVTNQSLARYYLRAIELKRKNDPEPEWIPNNDFVINLEHILPQNPEVGWEHFDTETAPAYYKRLGNMALMQASKNSMIGNEAFGVKKQQYLDSTFKLTAEVSAVSGRWEPSDIDDRQRELAQVAVLTWPIT